jgi:hypothetical protein
VIGPIVRIPIRAGVWGEKFKIMNMLVEERLRPTITQKLRAIGWIGVEPGVKTAVKEPPMHIVGNWATQERDLGKRIGTSD